MGPAYLWLALCLTSGLLMMVWGVRYRVALARADGTLAEGAPLSWVAMVAFGPATDPLAASPLRVIAQLRIEATPRPEPSLERMRRRLQSFKASTIVAVFGGGFVVFVYWGLTGLPWWEGGAQFDLSRVLVWSAILAAQVVAWALWIWRFPSGFQPTLAAGALVAAFWYVAIMFVGTPPYI